MSKKFKMTIDYNVLNHLGLNLYSNVPAVVSEVVANSWDADAKDVHIEIDKDKQKIFIKDDGLGMSEKDINDKYLTVGYSKRKEEGSLTPDLKRHVMGRKGIGKLSLFSIADIIEVYSVKDGEKNAFRLTAEEIRKHIKGDKKGEDYHPEELTTDSVDFDRGTKIVIHGLKRNISRTEGFLKKRLARRFSVIGPRHKFEVYLNGEKITPQDRKYFPNMEFLWIIGDDTDELIAKCTNLKKENKFSGVVDHNAGYKVRGWIVTFDERRNIEDEDNTLSIFAWGKIIQEDVLRVLNIGGIYTKNLSVNNLYFLK